MPENFSSHAFQPSRDTDPSALSLASPIGSSIHNRSKSALELRGYLQEQNQTVQLPSTGQNLSDRPYPLPGARQPTQSHSQDVWFALNMLGQGNPEAVRDGGIDRNVPAEARREALSEDRKRSSSHHGSERVDRQIEATMNDVEPSSNARSRESEPCAGSI